ncbi:MAG: prepilin-type N-terminal cleavage/methylation domain-containing protein [Candidatus Atribacteria bacterium]|nr:prepilin-type N-terminal cleavage/methylation domain-containing protein [Candidatus Atribacteria bacterium]
MPILVLQSGFTLIEIIIVISLISLLLFFSFTLYEIPEGVVLYRANFIENNILYFYPTGTPSSGGTITLRVKDRLKYVIITPVTGRVRISDTL